MFKTIVCSIVVLFATVCYAQIYVPSKQPRIKITYKDGTTEEQKELIRDHYHLDQYMISLTYEGVLVDEGRDVKKLIADLKAEPQVENAEVQKPPPTPPLPPGFDKGVVPEKITVKYKETATAQDRERVATMYQLKLDPDRSFSAIPNYFTYIITDGSDEKDLAEKIKAQQADYVEYAEPIGYAYLQGFPAGYVPVYPNKQK